MSESAGTFIRPVKPSTVPIPKRVARKGTITPETDRAKMIRQMSMKLFLNTV